ncbi:MAG: carboxypeptidase regulatory-like domain-containing protein [Coriobacteriia bacterium]|nr:carboxypeptidase regulatory-like domain-containing protein [Coriobacteriia bacterium]
MGTTPANLEQYYDRTLTISEATTLSAVAGESITVSSDLTPIAPPSTQGISGNVTNLGAPLDHIVVTAYDAVTHRDVKGVYTDALGNYTLGSLPAGSYHVRFMGTTPASLTQYFDHKVNITDAAVVTVTAGLMTTVSSDLAPTTPVTVQTISGTITNVGVPMNRVVVTAFNATTHAYVRGVFTNALGVYTLSLPAGSYHLRFTGMTPSSLTQYYDHQNRISNASVQVLGSGAELTIDSDLSGAITP